MPESGPLEDVIVQALGYDYGNWESVQIELSMQTPVVTATLTTVEEGGWATGSAMNEWNFPPGTMVEIYANGTPIFSGVVWQYMPQADASQHSITLICKTTTYNFVISSVKSETGWYQDTTDTKIILEWARAHGANVIDLSTGANIPWFLIKQGATNYEEAVRLIAPAGKMLFADAFGSLIMSDGKPFAQGGSLIQGINIEVMSAILKDDRYMVNEVIGQNPIGITLDNHIAIKAIAESALGNPFRYRKILDQRVSSELQAKAIANWHRNRNEGDAMQATISSPGWRDLEGALWNIAQDVYVNAPWLHIDCVLRTSRVIFTQNLQTGTMTELTLLDPRSVSGGGTPTYQHTACKSGGMWDLGFDIAEDIVEHLTRGPGSRGHGGAR